MTKELSLYAIFLLVGLHFAMPSLTRAEVANGSLADMQRYCVKMMRVSPNTRIPKVQIRCESEDVHWRTAGAVALAEQNTSTILASLSTMGYDTPVETVKVRSEPVRCNVLEQWRGKLKEPVDIEATCLDLLTLKSLDELCERTILFQLESNLSAITWERTGLKLNPCTGP